MKELLAKLLDDDEDMLDLHLSAKAAEADARTAALQRLSLDASRPGAADGAVSSHTLLLRMRRVRGPVVWAPCLRGGLVACAALLADSTLGGSSVTWLLERSVACPRAAELWTSCCRAHHCASTPARPGHAGAARNAAPRAAELCSPLPPK
jgi:hypothetical protein